MELSNRVRHISKLILEPFFNSFFKRLLDNCEGKDKKDSIENVRNFCNDMMSKESIKEKPPIYLLATLVDINKDKNQEEAIKVRNIYGCTVYGLSLYTGFPKDSVYDLCVWDYTKRAVEGLV